MFTYSIKTMGCKANIYDSLIIEKELREIGGERNEATPDFFIVNSCTVTEQADKQCIKEVQRVKKNSPQTFALVTGCFAQVAPEKIRENNLVNLVVPGLQKSQLKKAIAEKIGLTIEDASVDPEIYWGQLPSGRLMGKTRAFLKIQEGCNDFCTYCIIPYARGKSRSQRMGQILSEINRLAQSGVQEVVLTGTNIGDYGKEFESSLEDLIEAVLVHTSIPRLRLTSLDPTEITPRLLELMKNNSKLMPHFHVSLQSPVSAVLRGMKRHYRTEDVEHCLNEIYKTSPDIFVGMDVIAGFPGETTEHHNEGVQILSSLPWTRLHVFPYSERTGTPALKIKGSVPVVERKRRAAELMSLSTKHHELFCKRFVNQTLTDILFETVHEAAGDYFVLGHAPNYLRVLARVPSRSKDDAEKLVSEKAAAKILGYSPKPAQDFTLESFLI